MRKPFIVTLAVACTACFSIGATALPAEQDRIPVSFATDEATFSSVAVSPDGKTIYFDMLGDLYAVPKSGGKAERLTAGSDYDQMPRVSPRDGSILFLSDRAGTSNIWSMNADGTNMRKLTAFAPADRPVKQLLNPEWAPDGKSFIFGEGTAFEMPITLKKVSVETGAVEIIPGPSTVAGGPNTAIFGDGGRSILFASTFDCANKVAYQMVAPCSQIYEYRLGPKSVKAITYRQGGGTAPILSPDGRWLIYASRSGADTGLVRRDLRTQKEGWLAFPVDRDIQDSMSVNGALPRMSFTPDSRELVLSIGGKLWSIAVETGEKRAIPFAAVVEQSVAPRLVFERKLPSGALPLRYIRGARYSPDRSRLLFTARDKLWLYDVKSKSLRRLTQSNQNEILGSWISNYRVVYTAWSENGDGHVYAIDARRSARPARLTTESAPYVAVAAAPDGSWIAATRHMGPREEGDSPVLELVAIEPKQGTAKHLAYVNHSTGLHFATAQFGETPMLHFASNPERVYYTEMGKGLMSAGRSGEACHEAKLGPSVGGLSNGGDDQGYEIIPSPAGNVAIVRFKRHVYLAAWDSSTSCMGTTLDASGQAKGTFGRLSRFGGIYPSWSSDGRKVDYALGGHVFTADGSAALLKPELSPNDLLPITTQDVEIALPLQTRFPQGRLILRGGHVVTMAGDDKPQVADILIVNDRIRSIAPTGTLVNTGDARVIDISGKTVIPGMIDTHCHVRSHRHLGAMPAIGAWELRNLLAYGVTTCLDPYGSEQLLDVSDRLAAGEFSGARLLTSGHGIQWNETLRTQGEANDILDRETIINRTDFSKYYGTGNRLQQRYLLRAAAERRQTAVSEGMFYAYDISNIIDGIGGMAHSIALPYYRNDVRELIGATGTALHFQPAYVGWNVSGPLPFGYYLAGTDADALDDPKETNFYPRAFLARKMQTALLQPKQMLLTDHFAGQLKQVVEAGGLVGLGDHGEFFGLGYHWNLWALAPVIGAHDTLRIATIMGARTMGISGEVGSIEPGKKADLVILDEDPTKDIRASRSISMTMVNGRLFEADTLAEIYPGKAKPIELPDWWNDRPAGVPTIGGSRSVEQISTKHEAH